MCLNHQPHKHRIEFLNLLNECWYISPRYYFCIVPHEEYKFDNPIILKENRPSSIMEKSHEWERVNDNHLSNDIISLGDPNYLELSFCTVVTESVMHSDVFLSEKTFKPLIGLRPFIILGDGGLYDKLREWKFDTFEDLFPDTSKGQDKYWREGTSDERINNVK